ncbi:hypothetical protein A3B57_02050 [Microgenomates group bacterium RIFCSPLOWO2_01_FULL_47_10]|nr:MAG: hypothetical protein A3B57_02050 [Microgenomates group bacterium RIFCSPLOWO2_01_FULL_47_10]
MKKSRPIRKKVTILLLGVVSLGSFLGGVIADRLLVMRTNTPQPLAQIIPLNRPELGIRYRMIPKETALLNNVPAGAYLVEVVVGGSAKEAGLLQGDIILKIDGTQLDDEKESTLADLLNTHTVGDGIDVTYYREGETKTMTITLKESQ